MCLPEGVYTMTPKVITVNPSGGTSNTELPPVTVKVGCEQVIELTPELQVSLNDLPQETSEPILPVSGRVSSSTEVMEISATLNQGSSQVICSNCGKDPEFSTEIALVEGDNEVAVLALDESGNTASVKATVLFTPETVVEGDPIVVSTFGKVTGGGFILDETETKHTFGFNVHYDDKGHATMKGQLQFVDHHGNMNFHGNEVSSLMVDENEAVIAGAGWLNGEEGYSYRVKVVDEGNPGRGNDTFSIEITEVDSDSIMYVISGTLAGGNITVHEVKSEVGPAKDRVKVAKAKTTAKKGKGGKK